MELITRYGAGALTGETGVAVVGGGSLSDDPTDHSYLEITNNGTDVIHRDFDAYVVPSNKKILKWRIYHRSRFQRTNTGLGGLITFGARGENKNLADSIWVSAGSISASVEGSFQNVWSAWFTHTLGVGDWVNGASFRAKVDNAHINNVTYQLSRLYIQYQVLTEPKVNNIIPTGSNTSKNPTVSWEYIGNGEAQKRFDVMIVTKADWDLYEYEELWDDHTVVARTLYTSSNTCTFATANLLNGVEYIAVVRTAKDFNGSDYLGPWKSGNVFTVNEKPVVSAITKPTGVLANSNRPEVSFEYSDPELNPMTKYWLSVYSEAQYTAPGFDPDEDTEEAIWDTGPVDYSAQSGSIIGSKVTNTLPNGNYRLYAWVRETIDAQWSDPAFSSFTIDVIPPNPPLLTLTPHETMGRILIEFDRDPGGPAPEEWLIEKSLDEGLTWETVRGAEQQLFTGPVSLYDYEVLPNKPTKYRALLFEQTLDDLVASLFTEVETTLRVSKVWLKDVLEPDDNLEFPVEDTWLSKNKFKSRTVHRPIGRKYPLVTKNDNEGDSFSITYALLGAEKAKALDTLLAKNRILFVQTSLNYWYVEVMNVTWNEHLWSELRQDPDGEAHRVTVDYQEVSKSDVSS